MIITDFDDLEEMLDSVVQDVIDLVCDDVDAFITVDEDGCVTVSEEPEEDDHIVFSSKRFYFFLDTPCLRGYLKAKVQDYLRVKGFINDTEILKRVTY